MNSCFGLGSRCRRSCRANSKPSSPPMLCPKMANGLSRYGLSTAPSFWTSGHSRVNGRSPNRFSLPGNWITRISISGGNRSGQEWNIEAPPPAYGKQNRRAEACAFGFRQASQDAAGLTWSRKLIRKAFGTLLGHQPSIQPGSLFKATPVASRAKCHSLLLHQSSASRCSAPELKHYSAING